MKRITIILVLLLILGYFYIGTYGKQCQTYRFDNIPGKIYKQTELIEQSTYDGLLLKGDSVFDPASLTPIAKSGGDCKT